MPHETNRELVLKVALQAHEQIMAQVITQMAIMFAGYDTQTEPIDRFYPIPRVLYAKDKKARILVALPADHILWSEQFAGAVAEIKEKPTGNQFELWTAGDVSQKPRSICPKPTG